MLGRMLAIEGRAEIMSGKTALGMESIDASIHVSRAARDTTNWMTALGFKGFAVVWQGRYDECVELNRKRLELAQLSKDRVSEAWARTGLGYVSLQRGELAAARVEYATAADLFEAEGRQRAALTPLVGLGRVLNVLQEIDAARECYLRVLTTAREVGDRVQEAHAVNNLGTLEFEYGDVSMAAQYFERAYQSNYDAGDLRGTITPSANIALARVYLGQYSEAVDILTRAAQACEATGSKRLLGSVLVKLAEVRWVQSQTRSSLALYRQAFGLGDALVKKDHDEVVFGMARALTDLDSAAVAADLLTHTFAAAPPLPEYESVIGLQLSRCFRDLDRPEDALEQALAVERRIKEAQELRRTVQSALELSFCYNDLGRKQKALDLFYEAMDRNELRRESYAGREWREAGAGVQQLVDASGIVLEHPPDRPESERVEALFNVVQTFKARTLMERVTEPRRLIDPASGFSDLSPTTLSRLQQSVLEPGELFLDIVVGYNAAYLFAVTRDSCRVMALPGRVSELSRKVDLYCKLIGRRPEAERPGGAGIEMVRMQAELGNALLGGVSDLVLGSTRIVIAPESYLGPLPFGTLVVSDGGQPGTLLHETREIHQIPSAMVLEWLRAGTESGRDDGAPTAAELLAVGPIGSDELKGARAEVSFLQQRFRGVKAATGIDRKKIFDDPVAYEVVHVAAHVEVNNEKPWHSGILLEESEEGAHGRGDPAVRRSESGSTVGGPDTLASRHDVRPDPYLRAGEIAAHRISARLAVLSGCESALGRANVGEGVVGLTSAFLSAGVPAVVATLWAVDDAVTADLMKQFYRELSGGKTVALALKAAQDAIRGQQITEHPFYWAGFVVVGDGNVTVRLAEKPFRGGVALLLLLAATVAILATLGIWLRHNKLQLTK
jgi:tetratricopeptide (TPR) repeat protein